MRLLERGPDGNFRLVNDLVGDNIPEYAILSHTWGPVAEEVTFRDIVDGTGKDKAGYGKLRFCADQAERDGLAHFWVDTCCIDKTNNAELAEAINSMFRWYGDSARCYVFLSDVWAISCEQNDWITVPHWENAFRASRWFLRGWTLQELLAPALVQFFARDGTLLGDRTSLLSQIHEITGVAAAALRGEPLTTFDVGERFNWAENRQTTRAEDWAYSLLGIFGVFIPPIYGEGRVNAARRLRKEIGDAMRGESLPSHSQEQLRDSMSKEDHQCLKHLRNTDPRDDKRRLEQTKGGLLLESYRWVLENPDFRRWCDDAESRLLWIKGDPGKGKTMLLCGILDQLRVSNPSGLISFFFCQATDSRINSAIGVLRGLIYLLVDQQPTLLSHVRKKYDDAGITLFEDANAWVALTEIFDNIIKDPTLKDAFVVIDALDECVTDLPQLLDFIAERSCMSSVKWIVSSRNWPEIEEHLGTTEKQTKLCLELNAVAVSAAVTAYIQHKVTQLAQLKKYDRVTEIAVRDYLSLNADGTFLWVALVCQNLTSVSRWNAISKLKTFAPGLDSLYARILDQIRGSDDVDLCNQILAVATIVYRPLTLQELTVLVEPLKDFSNDTESVKEIIGLCGSFLTVREQTIYFVHHSAKEFLLHKASEDAFPSAIEDANRTILTRSLVAMSATLGHDMYDLGAPGVLIDQMEVPNPDPLATVRYSCLYWVDHLCSSISNPRQHGGDDDLLDNGAVHVFLKENYLYWLESLGLFRGLADGVLAMGKLEAQLVSIEFLSIGTKLTEFRDTRRARS
jgi:hypothetical protein